jgi:hypothetical protein
VRLCGSPLIPCCSLPWLDGRLLCEAFRSSCVPTCFPFVVLRCSVMHDCCLQKCLPTPQDLSLEFSEQNFPTTGPCGLPAWEPFFFLSAGMSLLLSALFLRLTVGLVPPSHEPCCGPVGYSGLAVNCRAGIPRAMQRTETSPKEVGHEC